MVTSLVGSDTLRYTAWHFWMDFFMALLLARIFSFNMDSVFGISGHQRSPIVITFFTVWMTSPSQLPKSFKIILIIDTDNKSKNLKILSKHLFWGTRNLFSVKPWWSRTANHVRVHHAAGRQVSWPERFHEGGILSGSWWLFRTKSQKAKEGGLTITGRICERPMMNI